MKIETNTFLKFSENKKINESLKNMSKLYSRKLKIENGSFIYD